VGRLRRRSEYLRVAAGGRKWAAPGLILQAREASTDPAQHLDRGADLWLGITVSRKVGNAVVRNRARRRLREAARVVLPKVAQAGHDYVLIGRSETVTRPYPALQSDIEAAVRRLGLARMAASGPA
jgi:ribonuclease P protein component